MSVSEFFSGLFANDEDVEDDVGAARAHAGELVLAERTPFVERFMEYLQEEADRPVKIGDQMSMVESAVRANTFKEIRAKLKRDFRQAREIIEEARHLNP